MRGQQRRVSRLSEATVDKNGHALVLFAAYQSTHGLHDAVHARVSVGKVKASSRVCIEMVTDQIPLETDLGQAHSHDGNPNQTFANKVYPFSENTSHHGEPDPMISVHGTEGLQEGMA